MNYALGILSVALMLALITGGVFYFRNNAQESDGLAYPIEDSGQRLVGSTSLALRKKLELPFQLNFSNVDLTKLLKWVEAQLDIEFRIQVDPAILNGVTVQASNRPLVETLCDVLSRRNMGLVLQRDAVAIVPCEQSVKTSIRGDKRMVSFQMEAQIPCEVEEPIEIYCGDRGQYRLLLLAHVQNETENYAITERSILTSLYVDRELKAFAEVQTLHDQWTAVPFTNVQEVALSLKPVEADDGGLVLGINFVYTQAESV